MWFVGLKKFNKGSLHLPTSSVFYLFPQEKLRLDIFWINLVWQHNQHWINDPKICFISFWECHIFCDSYLIILAQYIVIVLILFDVCCVILKTDAFLQHTSYDNILWQLSQPRWIFHDYTTFGVVFIYCHNN